MASQLSTDCPEQSAATRESIIRCLLGKDLERFGMLNPYQLEIAQQAMKFRYRILRHRYLGLGPEPAYRHLMQRLGSLVLLRNKIRTLVALSRVREACALRNRQRAVVDVLQEVIYELRYCQVNGGVTGVAGFEILVPCVRSPPTWGSRTVLS